MNSSPNDERQGERYAFILFVVFGLLLGLLFVI